MSRLIFSSLSASQRNVYNIMIVLYSTYHQKIYMNEIKESKAKSTPENKMNENQINSFS